jgi:filamentous hemagglutinin
VGTGVVQTVQAFAEAGATVFGFGVAGGAATGLRVGGMTASELAAVRASYAEGAASVAHPLSASAADATAATAQASKYARRTDVAYTPANAVNATFPEGWSSPYKPGTRVTEYTNTVDDVYVRLHNEDNMTRAWMMKREAVEGLTAEQLQSKYALPQLPTFMSEVYVPAGTRIRTGTVNPIFDGIGNATQYELLQRLPASAFRNTVRLGR